MVRVLSFLLFLSPAFSSGIKLYGPGEFEIHLTNGALHTQDQRVNGTWKHVNRHVFLGAMRDAHWLPPLDGQILRDNLPIFKVKRRFPYNPAIVGKIEKYVGALFDQDLARQPIDYHKRGEYSLRLRHDFKHSQAVLNTSEYHPALDGRIKSRYHFSLKPGKQPALYLFDQSIELFKPRTSLKWSKVIANDPGSHYLISMDHVDAHGALKQYGAVVERALFKPFKWQEMRILNDLVRPWLKNVAKSVGRRL